MSGRDGGRELHWLMRPATLRILRRTGVGLLALTLAAQLGVHVHARFDWDGVFGFYAVFGFLACAAMVVAAKVLGAWLKRPEDYYGRDDD